MAIVIFTGDSHTDGTGASPGMGWPDQLGRLLARDDVRMLNLARAGAPFGDQVELWASAIRPALDAASGVRIVFGMGGYNDVSRCGADAARILDAYARQAALCREAGVRHLAGLDVIRRDPERRGLNAIVRAVNQALREGAGRLDRIVDFASLEGFDRPDGPYERPPFAEDEIHLDDEGQRRMARHALPVFRDLLAGA